MKHLQGISNRHFIYSRYFFYRDGISHSVALIALIWTFSYTQAESEELLKVLDKIQISYPTLHHEIEILISESSYFSVYRFEVVKCEAQGVFHLHVINKEVANLISIKSMKVWLPPPKFIQFSCTVNICFIYRLKIFMISSSRS